MARKKGSGDVERSDESIGAATRRLTEATTALSAALKREAAHAVPDVSEALAKSLRETARSLSAVSESIGSGDRRRQKAARTRADLLAAACRVVEEKGYEGASVGDIAAAAGYTKGALYANYPSKADLFLALADEVLCEETTVPPPSFGQRAGEARQKAVADELLGTAERGGMLLVFEILSYGLRHPEARERLAPGIVRNLDEVARWVAGIRSDKDDASGPGAEGKGAAMAGPDGPDDAAGPGGVDEERPSGADAQVVEPTESDRDRALAIYVLSVLVPPLAEFTGDSQLTAAAARVIDSLLV